MNKEYLKFSDYKNMIYDEFGNRINNYIIASYVKRSNGEWVKEEERKTRGSSDYVINDKIYFECNDSLIPYNMDFESKDCGRCVIIVEVDKEEYKRIIANEVVKVIPEIHRTIHKQSYSDGTCFYTLKDIYGHWNIGDGNRSLDNILKRVEFYIHNVQ